MPMRLAVESGGEVRNDRDEELPVSVQDIRETTSTILILATKTRGKVGHRRRLEVCTRSVRGDLIKK